MHSTLRSRTSMSLRMRKGTKSAAMEGANNILKLLIYDIYCNGYIALDMYYKK